MPELPALRRRASADAALGRRGQFSFAPQGANSEPANASAPARVSPRDQGETRIEAQQQGSSCVCRPAGQSV
jgi:hypothetical protein